jgi:hypothetical protein
MPPKRQSGTSKLNRFQRLKNSAISKAKSTKFKMTSARKAALKKAQEASAKARKVGNNVKAAATSRFNKAGGNTKMLSAKIKFTNAAKVTRAAANSATSIVKKRGSKAVSKAKTTINNKTKGITKASVTAKARGLQYQALGMAQQAKKTVVKKAVAIKDNRKATNIGQTGRGFSPTTSKSKGTSSGSKVASAPARNTPTPSAMKNTRNSTRVGQTTRGYAAKTNNSRTSTGGRTASAPARNARVAGGQKALMLGQTSRGFSPTTSNKSKRTETNTSVANAFTGKKNRGDTVSRVAFKSPILESIRQKQIYGGKYQSRVLERARKAFTGTS